MMQKIEFSKMEALGNDFVVIDSLNQRLDIAKIPIHRLSDRHRGIGFDQLLLIEKSHHADFGARFFNADGSESEQCGNGVRCIARFIQETALSNKKFLTLETKASLIEITIHDYHQIEAKMGIPIFEPKDIPFLTDKMQPFYDISIDHALSPLSISVVSMGNPHAIIKVSSINDYPVPIVGALMESHALFPKKTNVGFMEIVDRTHIRLRTFERGVGETFACGSNACAAVVTGIKNKWLDPHVTVELKYGNLSIEWQGDTTPVKMIGPAERVFSGVFLV
jgi:diaminopimelate epimerase